MDNQNSGFLRLFFEDHLLSIFELHMHFKIFEDLTFVDDKLPTKTMKITSLKNLYSMYTVYYYHGFTMSRNSFEDRRPYYY